jgi:hypothetical protein
MSNRQPGSDNCIILVQMAEASRARVAVEEQLRKLQREADAERAAAQAREAQLLAKLGRLQEVSHPLFLLANL